MPRDHLKDAVIDDLTRDIADDLNDQRETPREMAARLEAERKAKLAHTPVRTVSRDAIVALRPGMVPYLQGEKPVAHACTNPPAGMTTRDCIISHYGPVYSSGLMRANGISFSDQRALTHPPATDEQQAASDSFLKRMLKENIAIADRIGKKHNLTTTGDRAAAQPIFEGDETKDDLVKPDEEQPAD